MISRFVSVEFNRFLEYYKDSADLNVNEKRDRGDRDRERTRDRRDRDRKGSPRYSHTHHRDRSPPNEMKKKQDSSYGSSRDAKNGDRTTRDERDEKSFYISGGHKESEGRF